VVRLTPRTCVYLLRRAIVSAADDGCFGIAKGAAYSALLSFFPVLTSAATILVQTRAEFVADGIERFLSEVVPPGTEDLVVQQFRVTGERPVTLLIIAALVSLWAASSVIKSLIDGFQAAYRVPRNRDFFHQSAVAILLVLGSAVPLICASALVLFGGTVERQVLDWMRVDPAWTPLAWLWAWLSRLLRYLAAYGATVLVTATLYYFGPYREQSWRNVWPGSLVAASLWLVATSGFGWYVRNMAHYNVMYGSVGAGIALLVWMYLLALIALIGCEFNAELERVRRV
jgi:membrane protein